MNTFIQIYLAGFALGVILTLSSAYLYYKIAIKRRKKLWTKIINALRAADNAKPDDVVTKRLLEVKAITEKQQELKAILEFPQKSAIDGKYKNGLIREIQFLEDQKNEILVSIVKDGHDPIVATVDTDGSIKDMPLSEYCNIMGLISNEKPQTEETLPPNVRKVGKFTVYSTNKPDGDGGTTH